VWNGISLEMLTMPGHGDLRLNPQTVSTEFVDFGTLRDALENYDEGKASAAFAKLKEILLQWNWQTKRQSRHERENVVTVIAALAVASFIQSVFKFRPMVCITGRSQSGKTELQRLFRYFFGRLSNSQSKPSAAAVRQSVGCDSNIVLLDEMEKDRHRHELLELLRTSTDGTFITRGQPNGRVQRFGMKHIVWLSSIEMNLANIADASRFFQFELQRPENKEGQRPFLKLDPQAIKQIGFALMVFAIKNMQSLLQTVEILSEANIEDCAPRQIETAALPTAFAEKLNGWTRAETLAYMYCITHENDQQNASDVNEDHTDLLQEILCAKVRVADVGELSVVQAIKRVIAIGCIPDTYAKEALERNGIKIRKTQNGDREVFFVIPILSKTLLKDTNWKDANIRQLLNRLPIAKETVAKFNGKTTRGVSVPLEDIIGTESEQDDELQEF